MNRISLLKTTFRFYTENNQKLYEKLDQISKKIDINERKIDEISFSVYFALSFTAANFIMIYWEKK